MNEPLHKPPRVTPFVSCPNCHRLLDVTAEHCPHCREPIDEDYRRRSAIYTVVVTQAVSSANTLRTFDPAVLLCVGITVWSVLFGFAWASAVLAVTAAMAVYGCVAWLHRYRGLELTNREFLAARRSVRWSLRLWGGFVVFLAGVCVWRLLT